MIKSGFIIDEVNELLNSFVSHKCRHLCHQFIEKFISG